MQSQYFDENTALWALAAACQLHRIPFEPGLVLQQFPPPHTSESLREALNALGFRSGLTRTDLDGLSELSGPCFLVIRSETEAAPDAAEPILSLALLLRCDGERLLIVEPGSPDPREFALTDFASRYASLVVQFAPEAKPLADPDGITGRREFGFSWFVPELLKHKAIWRDVLLASLAIQLVGLATPLFTQVVIDKVVVHQTLSTLAVIVGIWLAADLDEAVNQGSCRKAQKVSDGATATIALCGTTGGALRSWNNFRSMGQET